MYNSKALIYILHKLEACGNINKCDYAVSTEHVPNPVADAFFKQKEQEKKTVHQFERQCVLAPLQCDDNSARNVEQNRGYRKHIHTHTYCFHTHKYTHTHTNPNTYARAHIPSHDHGHLAHLNYAFVCV